MNTIKYCAAIAAICCAPSVLAESRAVEELNYQVGVTYGQIKNDDTTFGSGESTAGIGARITAPLATYFGVSLSGGYAEQRTKFDYGSITGSDDDGTFKTDSSNIRIEFFVRDFDIGKVGISYFYGRSQYGTYDLTAHTKDYDHADTNSTALSGAYYFQSATAFGRYLYNEWSADFGSSHSSLYSIGATYYPINNLSIGFTANRQPSTHDLPASDYQFLVLEYQPEFLGNSTSISLQLGNLEQSKFAMLSVNYFFDKRVDLMVRDRRHR